MEDAIAGLQTGWTDDPSIERRVSSLGISGSHDGGEHGKMVASLLDIILLDDDGSYRCNDEM